MLSPLSLELFANDVIRDRLDQAAQDALAAQLPHSPPFRSFRPDVAARQLLASGLRALATRLDPCLVAEPDFVVVSGQR